MQTRKDDLIDLIAGYLLEHGLADLSLRPLAAAIGTSARLLVYHFESKERLLGEVLEAMQARLRQSMAELLERQSGKPPEQPLKLLWRWAIAEDNSPYLMLIYELQVLAARNPETYGQYARRSTGHWMDFILSMLPASRRDPAFATLCGAVFDGLFIELMATGDRKRTTRAIDRFVQIVLDARKQQADA